MDFIEMSEAIKDAKRQIELSENFTRRMAEMIAGKLRANKVPGYLIYKLKKELRDFNLRTMKWKE